MNTSAAAAKAPTPAMNASAADLERKIWGVIAASAAGTVIEWYDFYIFGSLAALLSAVFYPESNAAGDDSLAAQMTGDLLLRASRSARSGRSSSDESAISLGVNTLS